MVSYSYWFYFRFICLYFYALKDAYKTYMEYMKYSIDEIKEMIQYLKDK